MSRHEVIREKRALLTPEQQAALEARLRAARQPRADEEGSPQSSEGVAEMVAQWEKQATPDWLDWAALAEAGRKQSREVPAQLDLCAVPLMVEAANRMSVAYICAALRELGAFTRAGESYTAAGLVERLRILPQYRKLLARWLALLTKERLIVDEGGSYLAPSPLPCDAVAGALVSLRKENNYDEYAGVIRLMQANGECLAAVITGRRIALENFFAGGSSEMADVVYQSAPHARYFNAIVRELLAAAAKALPAGRQLRVLEVGAGIGGTTQSLLPMLPPDETVYVFTDVSAFFLKKAERAFEKYPFVRFQLYDINEDPLALGFAPRDFDVVVGANVLHCARDLGLALRRLRSLMQPGGLLLLIEVTRPEYWHNIAMGLLTGFLNFEDERLGLNEPLLSPARWEATLRAHGFAPLEVFPGPGQPTEVIGQHVLLARTSSDLF